MAEFTGERVIPGEVEVDLWNEHVARYVFATRFAESKRVLDAGCGSGYGAAQLALKASRVLGVDVANEAIQYARLHYPMPNLHFLQASCTQLPARDGAFDLVVAFEIIEHLRDWQKFLEEASRLLALGGQFIVSTPNQEYYGASRGSAEPNPYHLHEFGYEEFRGALEKVFRHVSIRVQNQVAAFAFHPVQAVAPAEAFLESSGVEARHAHFFVGVCSDTGPAEASSWIYVPKAANVLRERELHIERLQAELGEKNRVLGEEQAEKQKLLEMFRQQAADLEQSNRWAATLDAELGAARNRIVALQQELVAEQEAARQMAAAYEAQVAELQGEVRQRTEWALETERRLEGELEQKGRELAECVRLLDRAEATVTERTLWAQRLQAELEQAEARLGMVRASRWMKLGRTLGLGPRLGNG